VPANRVLLVGTYHGKPGTFTTIQSAVDAAKPGDWILIAPGDYHEQYDHGVPVGDEATGAVQVTTANLHIRGMDRNAVVLDGTKPGAPMCSAAVGDQDFGAANADGKKVGRHGLVVYKADESQIENLTACNFLRYSAADGTGQGGNQIWWNGGDGSGKTAMGSYAGSYLTATSTFADQTADGSYGIFVSNASGPGIVAHTYASNMSDSSYYIGACPDCNATLDDAHAQGSALGYSGTNSGGHLIVENSEFDNNKTGFSTNSQNNDDAPSPQDGACPNNGIGPTGTHSCWIFQHNYVHDNNNANVPGHGSASLGPPGTGLVISGGRNDTVINNRFENNGSWGILTVPFPDTGTPPAIADCAGGDPNGIPALGIKGCYFGDWGNEIANNTFSKNGSFGNVTNGDIGNIADPHTPGNCFHGNTDPAKLTTAPANLQQVNGTCGSANEGATLTSDLSIQVICATEAFGACPAAPGKQYPRLTALALLPLQPQPTMPDPCLGVPSNPWCTP
jgi:Periplasmic copper-binding protein (NosD)